MNPPYFYQQIKQKEKEQKEPIKSSRGGYLRCPFTIPATFAAMAERHALSAFNSHKSHSLNNNSNNINNNNNNNNINSEEEEELCRPWCRAGVGAKLLQAKERREQQAAAERIYGTPITEEKETDNNNNNININNNNNAGIAVAVSHWEKSALQRVVPRGVLRRKTARRSGENEEFSQEIELDKGSSIANNNNNNNNNNKQRKQFKAEHREEKEKNLQPAGVELQCDKFKNDKSKELTSTEENNNANNSNKVKEDAKEQMIQKKPMNNLQRLDAIRNAALFGKKKKF